MPRNNYQIDNGLIVDPELGRCAGYIFNFERHGAYDPNGKVVVEGLELTQEQIDTHNRLLAKLEEHAMIQQARGIFYVNIQQPAKHHTEQVTVRAVTDWMGTFRSPWCTARKSYAAAWGGPIPCYHIWFTGPDGKRWYGSCKGNTQLVRGRRLKHQS